MLNLKKLIASVCAATVALSSVAFASNYSDVTEDSAYYEAVETLSKLNIFTGYEDGTFKPEDTVTRAEMAALIARIQGYEETAKANANTIFTDVPSENWASGYIAQATNQGILNGYGDGTFGPDDQVTYEQAVKMIMSTLGYKPYAENNGGYPTGYLAAAQKYSVTKNVANAVVGTGANRGTIAQLLNNAIDTPLMEQSNWNTNGEIEYTIYDGGSVSGGGYRDRKTLMSENLGVVKLRGVVTANSVTDINSTNDVYDATADVKVTVNVTDNYKTTNDDDEVQVGSGKTFYVGDSDAESFLGQSVIFYVIETAKDDYEVISMAADTARNDVVEFTLDQFDYYDSTNKDIYYFAKSTDDTSTSKKLETGVDVVYNGKGISDITDIFSAKGASDAVVVSGGNSLYGGKVTLIDNDTESGYDVVLVELAATAVVDEVSDGLVSFKESAKIALNDGEYSELEFDEDDDNTLIELTKDGEAISYTDLKEWDVLSIVASNDDNKGYIQARVISNTVTGTITADFTSKTSATTDGKGFKIDGTKYDVAAGAYKADKLAVGDAGTFYIDEYGKIAAFNEDSSVATGSAGNYAYVYNIGIDTNSLGDLTATFQLVTANGVEVLDLADTVTVYGDYEGGSYTESSASRKISSLADTTTNDQLVKFLFGGDITTSAATAADLIGTVVKYTTNTSGKLKTFTTAKYDEDKFAATTGTGVTGADKAYDKANGKLGSKFVDEDAIIFFKGDTADKSSVGTLSDLADETEYTVLAMYYDNKADDNNIVVLDGGKDAIDNSSSVAVITDISTGKNDNDEDIMYLTYVQDGKTVEGVETIDRSDIEGDSWAGELPTEGDVVKIKVNSAGKISNITKVFDFAADGRTLANAELNDYLDEQADTSGKDVYYGGVVAFAKSGGKVAFTDGDDILTEETATIVNISKAKNIYVIDFTGRNISVKNGSASSFKYNEKFYTAGSKIYDNDVDPDTIAETIALTNGLAQIDKYTDHVFVREYDENVEEVIIVKTPCDYKIK